MYTLSPNNNRWSGPAVEDLIEALQILPAKKSVGGVDKRSLGKSRRIIAELDKQGRPSQIAELLGIRTQKYTAIRMGVASGKISSATLNNMLEDTLKQASNLSYGDKHAAATIQGGKGKGRNKVVEVDYINVPQQFITDKVPWASNATPGGWASMQSALNWYANVGGAGDYFWIVSKRSKTSGRVRYYVYDIRTASEQQQHRNGKSLNKELKAAKVLSKYGSRYGIKGD